MDWSDVNWPKPYLQLMELLGITTSNAGKQQTWNQEDSLIKWQIVLVPKSKQILQIYFFVGICYQFNSNGSYKAEDAGLTSGLQFTLNVHPKDYYIGYFGFATGMSVREFM